jgi:hypothetical protein
LQLTTSGDASIMNMLAPFQNIESDFFVPSTIKVQAPMIPGKEEIKTSDKKLGW